ncbi:beta-L-arabinofuranosidase [Sarocladium implicatum]|nr:beta-L-arabinofuranosidase [Sarocladium implicatum]
MLLQSLLLVAALFSESLASLTVRDMPKDSGTGTTAPVRPFRLDQVHLEDGLLQEKRDRIKNFLREYDERRFLVLFNNQAGRPNPDGVEPPGVWEDGGELSGHWAGHFMSAISQAYADQGEQVFKDKLDWMVKELAACQEAITTRYNNADSKRTIQSRITGRASSSDSDWVPTYPGYLGAVAEDIVLRVGPPRLVYAWAPWYTQHKIVRGLLDAYYHTNNDQALEVVTKMGDWSYLALTSGDKNHPDYKGNITRDDLNYMWDIFASGEYGGANEVYAELYAITGDEKYQQVAKAFDNRASLFDASVEDRDILVVTDDKNPGPRRDTRLHANTIVPQYLGYLRIFEHGGENEYFEAAKNFFGWLVPHREYSHGGTGGNVPGFPENPELFTNRDNIAHSIAGNGAETCTTYNTLKLARNLFMHETKATYMDHYERGLFNMIAGSRKDEDSTSDPLLTYFQPSTPGSHREYGNTGTCCGGTGMESHTKYQETIYFRSADNSAIWVNLYVPSLLDWQDQGLQLRQETTFPRGDSSKLTLTGSGQLKVNLRVPIWVGDRFKVKVNGEQVDSGNGATPGSYLTLDRSWNDGDVIEVQMPMTIQTERARDRPGVQSLLLGPRVLQVVGEPTDSPGGFRNLTLYKYLKRDGDYAREAVVETGTTDSGEPLFTTKQEQGDVTLRPYSTSDSQAVSTYFLRVEPNVVFGSIDTGLENRMRNDALPNFDVPVEGVTLPGDDGPTFLDVLWDSAPFDSHQQFVDAVKGTGDEFVKKDIYTQEEVDQIVKAAESAEEELA